MQNPIISFKNVKFSYPTSDGAVALNGVSFDVQKGEFVAILGHNGSGKSTLARLINGLLCADEGEITVLGLDVLKEENIAEVRKHAGIVFQNPDNQMVASIVEDDVAFGPENIGVEPEEIGKRIEWALSAVGMQKYRNSTPTRLSGGQKQRIAIAGVLAIKPQILILDESTAMLDPKGRAEVISVVKKLNEEEGMTVILITHFMEEALLADRAIVMNKGEIAMQGSPEYIFSHGEILETFNLCLPKISEISNDLQKVGMQISTVLHPEELALQIANNFKGSNAVAQTKKEENAQKIAPLENSNLSVNIQGLNYTYSSKSPFATKALNEVNLQIKEGDFFGIIGHTGSGKSTLVQHLNALIKLPQAEKGYKPKKLKKGETPPTMSQITVDEFNLGDKKCDFKRLRATVGMVFQYPEYQLFAETVFDDVAFGLKNFISNLSKEEVESAVKESLEMVGLNYEDVKDKSPFDLSGGQKRRVAIAGVIVTKPKILILDEPAAGLDPLGKREIMALLHKLHQSWCKTVIIVSHDMDEIADNCTACAVISSGEIKYCNTPKSVFANGDDLISLGLDSPLCAKICKILKENGVEIDCDYSSKDFTKKVINAYCGGDNNA
ncbi:MAG: energy-coupling factor transporter ATPase [Clostridiales bacterium]|nr:energy-coupling factor transporter ATPase [Clostridiales bacterium]